MRRSAGSLSRLLATRSGAVVPVGTAGAGPGNTTDIQSEALTRLLGADEDTRRTYDGATFRVEGLVTETSKRHADPAYLTLQGHMEGETHFQVHCLLGSKERDSLHGIEVGHRVKVLGVYHTTQQEAGTAVILTGCKLVR